MKKHVRNYLLIRYEDLRDRYELVLGFIENKFKLIKKHNNYKRIEKYKGTKNYMFYIKNIELSKQIINLIKKNVNIEQEQSLGYLLN